MIICNSIQYSEREADYGGHEEARMITGTIIQGEQNCTSAIENTEQSIHVKKRGFKKKGMDLKSRLQLS